MTTRIRRTPEQIANDLEARARVARSKAKNMERARQTRRAIIAGTSIEAMAAAGDSEAKSVWEKMLAGLRRKHDREAFGLEPLPDQGPEDHLPVNPPVIPQGDAEVAANARLTLAVNAWKDGKDAPRDVFDRLKIEVGEATAQLEQVTGVLWDGMKPELRRDFGLTDRPGVLVKAVRASQDGQAA
jgi:hypothetical protein